VVAPLRRAVLLRGTSAVTNFFECCHLKFELQGDLQDEMLCYIKHKCEHEMMHYGIDFKTFSFLSYFQAAIFGLGSSR
jgi:hypothetical protein